MCVRAYHFQTNGAAAWYAFGSTWFFDSLAATTIAAATWALSGGDDDGRRKARFKAFFANRLSLM